MRLDNLDVVQQRIGDALNTLTELNSGFWGFGGAAGDPDRAKIESLFQVAWKLEAIIAEIGA